MTARTAQHLITQHRPRARAWTTARLGAAALSLTAMCCVLTGCGDESPDAAATFKAAQESMREAGGGGFTFGIQADGADLLQTKGTWASDPDRARWTTVVNDSDFTVTDEFATDAERVYRLPDGEPEGCWFSDPLSGGRTSIGAQPGAVALVLESRATGWETEGSAVQLTGSVDFVLQAIGDLTGDVRLPEGKTIEFDYLAIVDKGRVASIGTTLGEVLRSVKEGGGTVPDELAPFLTETVDVPILAGFSPLASSEDVVLPKPSEVKDCDG